MSIISFTTDDEKTFVTPKNWSDVEVSQYLKYSLNVKKKEPECLKQVHESEDIAKAYLALKGVEKIQCLQYFCEYIACFTSANVSAFKGVDTELIAVTYFTIYQALYTYDVIEDFSCFRHKGKTWYLPKKHMYGASLIEFLEAAEFERVAGIEEGNGDFALLDVIAILCRPKGEVYDQKLKDKRKEVFRDLTMDKVWNISFFLLKLNLIFMKNTQIYSLITLAQTLKQKN